MKDRSTQRRKVADTPWARKQGKVSNLTCPDCDTDNVFPQEVKVWPVTGPVPGHFEVDASREGPQIRRMRNLNGVSGVVTEMYYFCEKGHQWVELRQFEKGKTLVETRTFPDHDYVDGLPATLWEL